MKNNSLKANLNKKNTDYLLLFIPHSELHETFNFYNIIKM